MRRWLAIFSAKILNRIIKLLKIGAGGTWPGEIALLIDPQLISSFSKKLPDGVVLIAGTNGKTTTVKMINTIIEHRRKRGKKTRIVHNSTGANLLNGIAASLTQSTDILGRLHKDMAIFEVDEATLPLILKQVRPKVVVLMNLFRDQLDRYGEVDLVAKKWLKTLKSLPRKTVVIINADDPHLVFIGKKLSARTKYFGIEDKRHFLDNIPHAVDTIYCPNCAERLLFKGVYLSHLSEWSCQSCGLRHPINDLRASDIKSPLAGVYSIYNTMAAILTTEEFGLDSKKSTNLLLKNFQPAFGRQEEIIIQGKKIVIYLVKNPAGFNVSLETVLNFYPKVLLLALNDHIPDGRDVSWIWDVDFEMIRQEVTLIVSGDRAYDLGLRMKYTRKSQKLKDFDELSRGVKGYKYNSKLNIYENLKEAIEAGLAEIKRGETLYILPTYTAMLEVRKILKGRKIL